MRIWKYRLGFTTQIQHIEMPVGSHPISVIEQEQEVMLYVEVPDEETIRRLRNIQLIGTGDYLVIGYGARFIGTVSIKAEGESYHVYDLGDEV